MTFEVGICMLLFILYWWLLSQLADTILEAPTHKPAHWVLIGILNAFIVFGIAGRSAFLAYFTMMILMLVELLVFYKNKFYGALLCTLACALHALSIFTITIGSLATIVGCLPYEILANHESFILSVIISFSLLHLITWAVMKFVPLSQVKLINQHKKQQWFIIAWMTVIYLFLLYMVSVWINAEYHAHGGIQIAASIVSIISLYIVLYFSLKTSSILGYKEINAVLEAVIHPSHQYNNPLGKDALTGLYNKNMSSRLIDEYLSCSKRDSASAFFIIDVDDFKEINSHLGHVYGDAVLCELGEKLVQIFSHNDIVGRIGWDEFIVLLKDGDTAHMVKKKAQEICKAFHIPYKGINGEAYTISSSIGISFFPRDGNNFKDLYKHADIALYVAKNEGKNTYKIYDGCSFTGYTSQRPKMQFMGYLLQKNFRKNRIEYVFKILYQSSSSAEAIHSVLGLVASHFSFERGYIFETSKDGKTTSNTFEWCAEGITAEIGNLQGIPIEAVATANASFQKNGTFILNSLHRLPPIEQAVLEPQGIKSMFQFGIFDKIHLLGFIGFDNCRNELMPSDAEIDEMTTICNILATFFVKQHIDDAATKKLLVRQEVLNHFDSYIYVINPETFEVLYKNDKIQTLMQNSQSETACYRFFRGNTEQCEDCPLHKLRDDETVREMCELYNEKLHIWMEVTASTLRWADGSLACLINCVDITKQKEIHQRHIHQLETIAYVDELTGCCTYYKFKEDAQRILEKQQDVPHFLVKLDIENFKLINQIYGYAKGNEVLCCVAKAIEKTRRNKDEIFARVNNDEFVALFTIQEEKDMEELYENFRQHFFGLMGNDFGFKCNFPHGRYIIYPNNTRKLDVNDMFEKANIAHKAAKLNKTLNFVLYDERMTEKALHMKEIENKMAAALENNEFTVYLQPQYYLNSESLGGAEALTRWKNENSNLLLPSAFIPIFEQNGFIVQLDFYIFRKVCNIIKEWIEAGIEPAVVSVNFSRLHLSDANFVKKLCDIADNIGVHRKYLEIEITETVIYDNIDTLEVLLHDIHKNGFSMSMDDFGSGYSSLGMLKNLPVDVIKLDRSFFASQKNAERTKTVVGCVIQMAARLGIRTVAEGVEEQNQIDFLRELQCDIVQGYYFAKPMEVESFTKLLGKQKGKGK